MYKYYDIPNIEVLGKIIGIKPTLKFSSAFNLNDPFELKFNIEMNVSDAIHRKGYFEKNPSATFDQFENWKKQTHNNEGYLWYHEQDIRKKLSSSLNLCSFSSSNNNNLMWSHYSNKHEGICVEYDNKVINELRIQTKYFGISKIAYSKQPPTINLAVNTPNDIARMMLFNKQLEWKYEQEKRIVIWSNNNEDFVDVSPENIKKVFIGSRANKEIVAKVSEYSTQLGFDVLFGVALGKTYEVTFHDAKANTFFPRSFYN